MNQFVNYLDDLSPMPYGKHKGVAMQDVPADYFHYLWTNGLQGKYKTDPVARYIESRLNHLKQEFPDGIWK